MWNAALSFTRPLVKSAIKNSQLQKKNLTLSRFRLKHRFVELEPMNFVPGGPQGHSSRLKFHDTGYSFLRAEERGLSLEMNTPTFMPCPQCFVASGRSSDTRHLSLPTGSPTGGIPFYTGNGIVGRDGRSRGRSRGSPRKTRCWYFFGKGIEGRDDRSHSKLAAG